MPRPNEKCYKGFGNLFYAVNILKRITIYKTYNVCEGVKEIFVVQCSAAHTAHLYRQCSTLFLSPPPLHLFISVFTPSRHLSLGLCPPGLFRVSVLLLPEQRGKQINVLSHDLPPLTLYP